MLLFCFKIWNISGGALIRCLFAAGLCIPLVASNNVPQEHIKAASGIAVAVIM